MKMYYEIHLQDNVTAKYMEKHYPYLDLIDLYYNSELGNIKAAYIWNKDLKTNPTTLVDFVNCSGYLLIYFTNKTA